MSYEGYSQFICKKGHYFTKDCYEIDYLKLRDIQCPFCSNNPVWENMVDTTNGSFDDEGNRIDGYIDLETKNKTSGVCSRCGEEHICEVTYKIPKKKKN
jgi:hypothetical protein